MSETKFTPGPWSWSDGYFTTLVHADGEMLLYYTIYDDGVHASNKADKALIAAAPDMYAALQEAVELLASGPSDTEVAMSGILPKLNAILARARGET